MLEWEFGRRARIGVPEDLVHRVGETGWGCPSPASPAPCAFQGPRAPPGILGSWPPLGGQGSWGRGQPLKPVLQPCSPQRGCSSDAALVGLVELVRILSLKSERQSLRFGGRDCREGMYAHCGALGISQSPTALGGYRGGLTQSSSLSGEVPGIIPISQMRKLTQRSGRICQWPHSQLRARADMEAVRSHTAEGTAQSLGKVWLTGSGECVRVL